MDDLVDVGERSDRRMVQAQGRQLEVARDRRHAPGIRLDGAEDRPQRLVQAPRRVRAVVGADQRDHAAVGVAQGARQHLHPDEAGRAGQQQRHARARSSSTSISSPIRAAIASASPASSAWAYTPKHARSWIVVIPIESPWRSVSGTTG